MSHWDSFRSWAPKLTFWFILCLALPGAALAQLCPALQVRNSQAVLMVNGTGERLWSQAQAFARRLTELGVRHETIALEGAPHGMENWEGHPEWMFYKRRVIEWIQNVAR